MQVQVPQPPSTPLPIKLHAEWMHILCTTHTQHQLLNPVGWWVPHHAEWITSIRHVGWCDKQLLCSMHWQAGDIDAHADQERLPERKRKLRGNCADTVIYEAPVSIDPAQTACGWLAPNQVCTAQEAHEVIGEGIIICSPTHPHSSLLHETCVWFTFAVQRQINRNITCLITRCFCSIFGAAAGSYS